MIISGKISQVNFKILLSCQFQTFTIMSISKFYYHVNFKLLLSCQFQTSTVLSISNSCSHVKSISIYIHNAIYYMFGQVTSSHPRTACACQFTLVIGQVTSSHPRTACTCRFAFILVIGQVTSSNPRTACTCALCVCYQPSG